LERNAAYGIPRLGLSFDVSGSCVCQTPESIERTPLSVFDSLQQTSDPQSKSSLLDMARAWLSLVTQGEKNADAPTLVYVTPEPRQQVAQQQQQPQPKKE
jgi:hypothetical protein